MSKRTFPKLSKESNNLFMLNSVGACKRALDTSTSVQEVVCAPFAVCCSLAEGEGSAGMCHQNRCCSLPGKPKHMKADQRYDVLPARFYVIFVVRTSGFYF